MTTTWAHTKRRSRAEAPEPTRCETAFERNDQWAGHSFSPAAIRDACQPRSVRTTSPIMNRMKSASPRCEPSNRRGRTILRIQTATTIPSSTARMKTSTIAMYQP